MCETRSHSDLEINEGVMKFVSVLIRLFVAICITDITLNWVRISKVIRSGKITLKNFKAFAKWILFVSILIVYCL